MRLSEQDRAIIVCSQLQADASCAEIAKACGYREHTVRHSLQKLERSGLIKRYPFINVHALGFENFVLNFSLNSASSNAPSVLEALSSSEHTAWVSNRTGDFQQAVSLFFRNSTQMLEFMDHLSRVEARPFQNKAVIVQVSCVLFPRKYLCDRDFNLSSLRYGHLASPVVIDEVDHKILSALSYNPSDSNLEIARKLRIPGTTVTYRIEALKQSGVISGFAYAFHSQDASLHAYKLIASFSGLNAGRRQEVYSFCERHPNIVSLISCVGGWDYEIKIEAFTQEHVERVVSEFVNRFSAQIQSITTFSLFRAKKINYYPFRNFATLRTSSYQGGVSNIELQQTA